MMSKIISTSKCILVSIHVIDYLHIRHKHLERIHEEKTLGSKICYRKGVASNAICVRQERQMQIRTTSIGFPSPVWGSYIMQVMAKNITIAKSRISKIIENCCQALHFMNYRVSKVFSVLLSSFCFCLRCFLVLRIHCCINFFLCIYVYIYKVFHKK